jgi:hypothetical protein
LTLPFSVLVFSFENRKENNGDGQVFARIRVFQFPRSVFTQRRFLPGKDEKRVGDVWRKGKKEDGRVGKTTAKKKETTT